MEPGVMSTTVGTIELRRSQKMKTEKEEKERLRKAYAAKGERSQKMVTFRCDLENIQWLEEQPNKGRYINELIAADRQLRLRGESR